MNVLLVGEEAAGLQAFRLLLKSPHKIVGVLTAPRIKEDGRASLWNVAQSCGYPTWPSMRVKDPDFAHTVRACNVDILLNVHSLFIINKDIIRAPCYGSFNLHPGPLPRYAGLNPVSWALYRGETMHGTTLHGMETSIDTGSIAYQIMFDIHPNDTALTVSVKCAQKGLQLLNKLLTVAATDPSSIPQIAQDLGRREYFGRAVPQNGRLFWSRPATDIANFVRACDYFPFRSPWGHPATRLGEQDISIAKVHLTGQLCLETPGTIRASDGAIYAAAADEWIRLDKVLVNGTAVSPKELLHNGDCLHDLDATLASIAHPY